MRSALRWSLWLAGACAALVLALSWARLVTDERIDGDDLQTLTMAVNLRYHGVASLALEPPYVPSMYREPVPVATAALSIWLADAIYGEAGADAYLAGERARLLKFQNLFWLTLLSVAAFFAAYLLTSSRALGVLAVLLTNVDVIPLVEVGLRPLWVDSLMSEVSAAALMLTAGVFLVVAVRTRRAAHFAAAGACFGLLALTKAAFLYVFIGFAAVLLGLAALGARKPERPVRFGSVAALTLAFVVVVGPWVARNYVQLGELKLAERGGVVLYLRALKNEMTAEEYRGAIYFWAPKPLQPMLGDLFGIAPGDLQRGGSLQRLNRLPEADFYRDDIAAWRNAEPEATITFIRRALAEQLRLERLAATGGTDAPADDLLQRRAADMIAANPLKHLAATPLFLWRGAFFPLPVLLAALVYAMWRRDVALGLFVVPGLGTVAFFGLLTHYLPRYSAPILPLAVVTVIVLGWSAVLAAARLSRLPSQRAVPRGASITSTT